MRRACLIVMAIFAAGCGDDADDGGDGGGAGAAAQARQVTGYTFQFVGGQPVTGAVVTLAENPSRTVTSGDDGTYTFEVTDGEVFTPFVEHPGFVSMHLQTFTAGDADLTNVNFQMVTKGIYDAFAATLAITPDPGRCQIATTVNTIEIRNLTLQEFNAYGAHGVAGATVDGEPPVADTVYFNASVIPDRSLSETSQDGGVVLPNVEPGVYVISASHASASFAPFTADCRAGRLINAGPPWGLREL